MRVDFLAGWSAGVLLVDRSGVGGVCHGPRRKISTKKVAVIVQNYHREPFYFDDNECLDGHCHITLIVCKLPF